MGNLITRTTESLCANVKGTDVYTYTVHKFFDSGRKVIAEMGNQGTGKRVYSCLIYSFIAFFH